MRAGVSGSRGACTQGSGVVCLDQCGQVGFAGVEARETSGEGDRRGKEGSMWPHAEATGEHEAPGETADSWQR